MRSYWKSVNITNNLKKGNSFGNINQKHLKNMVLMKNILTILSMFSIFVFNNFLKIILLKTREP